MNPVFIKIIAGVVATFAFALIFRLKPSHWAFATLDGLLACVAYFVFAGLFETDFLPYVLSAFICAYGAEVFARVCKAPATVFLLPGCIALVPGGSLYYSMSNLLSSDYVAAAKFLLVTVEVGVAIGAGFIIASIVRFVTFKLYDSIVLYFRKK